MESSFFCHYCTVETKSRYHSESEKSSEVLLVVSWAVLVLGLGDSGGAVNGNKMCGGESGLIGRETVEAGFCLKNESNCNCLPCWYCCRMTSSPNVRRCSLKLWTSRSFVTSTYCMKVSTQSRTGDIFGLTTTSTHESLLLLPPGWSPARTDAAISSTEGTWQPGSESFSSNQFSTSLTLTSLSLQHTIEFSENHSVQTLRNVGQDLCQH